VGLTHPCFGVLIHGRALPRRSRADAMVEFFAIRFTAGRMVALFFARLNRLTSCSALITVFNNPLFAVVIGGGALPVMGVIRL